MFGGFCCICEDAKSTKAGKQQMQVSLDARIKDVKGDVGHFCQRPPQLTEDPQCGNLEVTLAPSHIWIVASWQTAQGPEERRKSYDASCIASRSYAFDYGAK